jgi:hypothetical protein
MRAKQLALGIFAVGLKAPVHALPAERHFDRPNPAAVLIGKRNASIFTEVMAALEYESSAGV